jgi:hypothetical protein
MGWTEKMSLTTKIIVDNMEKGIAWKNNVTAHKLKYEEIIDRECNRMIRDGTWWTDDVYRHIQKEFSYNLQQHEWVIIGGKSMG